MERGYHEEYIVGDKLILELTTKEIYEGEYSDGGKNRIDLTNVRQHNNKNILEGIFNFYRSEILSIRTLQAKRTTKQLESNIDDPNEEKVVIKISADEYYRLKELSKNYIFIENADHRYFKAVKELIDAETIGVVCLGMNKKRNASIVRLLVMCTWTQIYIFDLASHKNRYFYPELKEILECSSICKVIHKSAGIVDILYRWYDVYCVNTFDTMLVDLMIQKNLSGKCPKTERGISECLNHYLNFPLSLLENALLTPEKIWIERPLSDKHKLYAAQLVTYLILLQDQMQKMLFKSMYDMINNVQNLVYQKNDFDFNIYMCSDEVTKEIDELIPNINIGEHKNSHKVKICKENSNDKLMKRCSISTLCNSKSPNVS